MCGRYGAFIWSSFADCMGLFCRLYVALLRSIWGPFGALLRIVWGSFVDYVEFFCGDLNTYLQASSFLKAHPLRSSVRSICGLGCMVLSVRSHLCATRLTA